MRTLKGELLAVLTPEALRLQPPAARFHALFTPDSTLR